METQSIARWQGRSSKVARWDFKCIGCGRIEEHSMHHLDRPEWLWCPTCGDKMLIQPPTGTSFSIKGFNAANGYGGQAKE